MQRLLILGLILFAVLFSACSSEDNPPPTELVIITPEATQAIDPTRLALEATVESLRATNVSMELTVEALEVATEGSPAPTTTAATSQATTQVTATSNSSLLTPLPTATIPPSAFPTPRVELVSIVEQLFEGGRMIWFRENRMVWVLVGEVGEVDPEMGDWFCFTDSFQEGDIEFLPTFEPPAQATTESAVENISVQQPIRGFGKIWRDNPDLRERLGWALTAEIEHSARREYIAGGVLDLQDNYTPGPGEWRVQSFYSQTMLFYEEELGMACPEGTWRARLGS